MEKRKKLNEKGITLIALIVTIIVLIILAGISIGTLTGDNGLIKQAQTAKTETERSDIEEKINVIVIDNSKEKEMDKDKLINDFENKLPDGKEIVDNDNLIYIIYPEYSFEVDIETGDVKETEIEKVEDETPWELAGSGTEEYPYLIESIEDLIAFSNSVNSGENDYYGDYVKLTTDLDFNLPFSYDNPKTKVSEKTNRIIEEDSNGKEIKEFLTSGTGFNPIGNNGKAFRGNFDGNGKEIKNIYINRLEEEYVGLFGYSSGVIEKLKLTGKITGGNCVGGISGRGVSESFKINYCCTDLDIIGKYAVGGILGTIGNVSNSYSKSHVVILGEEGHTTSADAGAGIAYNAINIENSYNLGKIELQKGSGFIAGIVANSNGTVINSVNVGELAVGNNIKASFIGGIVSRTGSAKNSYNFGIIDTSKVRADSGGIKGEAIDEDETVKDCYYLKGSATGGIAGEDIEGQAMPLEESEMPSVISVLMTDSEKVEWNGEMVDIWKEDTENINNGYPILFWQ